MSTIKACGFKYIWAPARYSVLACRISGIIHSTKERFWDFFCHILTIGICISGGTEPCRIRYQTGNQLCRISTFAGYPGYYTRLQPPTQLHNDNKSSCQITIGIFVTNNPLFGKISNSVIKLLPENRYPAWHQCQLFSDWISDKKNNSF